MALPDLSFTVTSTITRLAFAVNVTFLAGCCADCGCPAAESTKSAVRP